MGRVSGREHEVVAGCLVVGPRFTGDVHEARMLRLMQDGAPSQVPETKSELYGASAEAMKQADVDDLLDSLGF